jgi:triacylglycerol lipase
VGARVDGVRGVTTRAVRAVVTPSGLRGVVLETAWVAAHVAYYPLGFRRERRHDPDDRHTLRELAPVQRALLIGNVEAAGTPILLIHGLVDNRSIFTVLRRALRRRGFGRIVAMNYSPFTTDIRSAALKLAREVEALCESTGYERIHLVGHSLGGLIARYFVQCLGGDARVHTVVCLGAPHEGTEAARLLPQRVVRQLRPDSHVLRELARPAPGCRTRFLAIWSDLDQLIVPKQSARIHHPDLFVRNVLVRGLGHLSLPIDGRVVHEICTTLAHLDSDGHTVTAGITSIGAGVESSQPATGLPAPRKNNRAATHPA